MDPAVQRPFDVIDPTTERRLATIPPGAKAAALHQVSIEPRWTISDAGGRTLPPRLIALLKSVQQERSLLAACRSTAMSYRHAWQLVNEGEAVLGAPLMTKTRYQGSRLTAVAEKLVWAESQVQSRLSTMLRSLESELEADIGAAPVPLSGGLRLHAPHGPAVAALRESLATAGVDLWYRDSPPNEALTLLEVGRCDVVGLFAPTLNASGGSIAALKHRRDLGQFGLLPVATRKQGLLVARGNSRSIAGLDDLLRSGVRFASREPGSEARSLSDWLFTRAGIDPTEVAGNEAPEQTQSAVAAAIANGSADAGIGLESLARESGFDFIPLHTEYLLLIYHATTLRRSAMRELLRTVQGSAFRAAIDRIDDHGPVDTAEPIRLRSSRSASKGRSVADMPSPDAAGQPSRPCRPVSPESAIDRLLSRRSISPKRLRHPAPGPEDIDRMLQAALSGPDHGGLRPWRVIEIREAQRAALADCFEQEKLRRDPLALPGDLQRAREHATRPPALLAFVVSPRLHHKVPVREQTLAAGAALGNLLNAAHQLGFGAITLSGERCFDQGLLDRLKIDSHEFLAAFVSLGSMAQATPPPRQALATRGWSCWAPEG